jgi:hypothetical protein
MKARHCAKDESFPHAGGSIGQRMASAPGETINTNDKAAAPRQNSGR